MTDKLKTPSWKNIRESRKLWERGIAIKTIAEEYGWRFKDTKDIVTKRTWNEKSDLEQKSTENATIEQAYTELSHASFAYWIRMHTFTEKDLSSGRKKIALKLGICWQRLAQIIPELKNTGYVEILSQGSQPMKISIKKRLVISRDCKIISLG